VAYARRTRDHDCGLHHDRHGDRVFAIVDFDAVDDPGIRVDAGQAHGPNKNRRPRVVHRPCYSTFEKKVAEEIKKQAAAARAERPVPGSPGAD
jgi:hypothetical protein